MRMAGRSMSLVARTTRFAEIVTITVTCMLYRLLRSTRNIRPRFSAADTARFRFLTVFANRRIGPPYFYREGTIANAAMLADR